ncbi:MAG: hypothetical protein ACRDJW_01990 [Thermomicrobiales bacterium]
MRHIGAVRLVGGLAMLLALFGATISTGSAQPALSSITIHNRICPVEFAGDDLFGDCHGNPRTSGLEFFIDGPVADGGPTDGAGNITFGDLPAGTYEISGGVPGEFADTFVYCSINEDPNNVLPVTGTVMGVSIDVPAGVAVVCDWYNIPIDLNGDGDGDDDDGEEDDTPPAKLPSTGSGVTGDESGAAVYLGGAAVMALAGLALVARRRAVQL